MSERVAVMIPCYNEAKTIEKVVRDFKTVLPDAEIIVYDNNSNDGTDDVARKGGAKVFYEHKQGKGNVVRTMFRNIDADVYILVDGDDTYPAQKAPAMIDEIINNGMDMVIGDRLSTTYHCENKRLFHSFGNNLVRMLIKSIFNADGVDDIMTGYRAFSKLFVKSFPIVTRGFEIETEMTIHALDKNFNITQIPVEYRDRPNGSVSKLNTFSDGVKVIRTIGKLFRDYKPLTFFSGIAALTFLIGLCLFSSVFVEFMKTGLVLRLPTMVVSIFIFIISILLEMCGLVLHVIVAKHRQLYELQLNIIKKINDIANDI